MHASRRPTSVYEGLFETLRAAIAQRTLKLTGLGLIAAASAIIAALATWSVDDPSLNHATDAPIRNMLGWPGAIIADLLMQLTGLAAVAALVPPVIWGWRLLRGSTLGRLQLRVALWILGSGASTAVASALPATARWPLPSGLGGVAGDALLAAAKAVTGLTSGPGGAIVGFGFAVLAILSLSGACTLSADPDEEPAPTGRAASSRDWEEPDEPGADEPGWGIVSLGALAHAAMSLRAVIRRRLAAHKRSDAPLPGIGRARTARREPVFETTGRSPAGRLAPVQDEYDDEDSFDAVPVSRREAPSARVASPTPAPRPGKRISQEAQPSLLDEGQYQLPARTLLAEPKRPTVPTISEEALEQNATLLEGTLEDFGVKGEIINVRPGPVVTLYELEPAPGTKSSRVISLADDIARSMSAVSARVAVVSGRNAIGIELPNHKRETVYLRELLASQDFETTKHKLALCLGKTIGGEPVIADLARMPHLLVAGTTGSGKSVAINTMILSLVYRHRPEECRLIMVDPKMLELSVYDGIPHLLTPVVTDPKKAVIALKWAVREMEDRYKKMSKLGVRNIDGFNARVAEAKAKGEVITRTVQTGFDRATGEAIYEDEIMDLETL
ncbi:DNA translocase FtsK 4TM domain-containing protein, partial [Microvirga massiliensis]|uniref:DNA translocase FtsK 4TM domain-containing protein n=1 Tax=Microvirga massiliensis TaxID=1033741 RepID=UPI00069BB5BC